MKVETKGDFFQVLKKSRLLNARARVDARAATQGLNDPGAVAARLVEAGQLTRWQARQLLAGHTKFFLGKYKLLKVCGRGGMGVVFKAEQPDVDRVVAIKVLHHSLLSRERAVSRFLREMRLAAVLNHPNLVTAYDADRIGNTYFLVMEYASGRSLKYYSLKRGRLPVVWSCECIRQASLGLQHIHERGLVHRDVKLSNILVLNDSASDEPKVKVLDVGLSRFASENQEDEGLTRAGQIVGTVDYMAPEQVKDACTADIRSDIYGLGASLFQLLTGAPPLVGKNLLQTYLARATQEAPLVSSLRPNVPRELDAVVAKMLRLQPDERYQSPGEVAAALTPIVFGGAAPEPVTRGVDEPPPRGDRYDSSDDMHVTGMDSSLGAEADSSLFAFLEQLSQDESSNFGVRPTSREFGVRQPKWLSRLSLSRIMQGAWNWIHGLMRLSRRPTSKKSGKAPPRNMKASSVANAKTSSGGRAQSGSRKRRRRASGRPPASSDGPVPPEHPSENPVSSR